MTAQAPALADVERYARLLWRDGDVREVRIPKAARGRTHAGYFDDPAALAAAAVTWDGRANVYVTINPVDSALLARAAGRIGEADSTTSDQHVLRRAWLPVDIDPVRPTGISATDAQVAASRATARAIAGDLMERGWGLPITSLSGNGHQLLYPVDLPNDADAQALVAGVLAALAATFDSDAVKVDTTVSNAARIMALIGTMKVKGDSTPDRPHRRSALIHAPETLEPVPVDVLRALLPPPEPRRDTITVGGSGVSPGWVRARLEAKGIVYREQPADAAGRAWYHVEDCPWHPGDGAWECGPGEAPSGMGLFHGFHDRCTGKGWRDFRDAVGLGPEPAPMVSADPPVPSGRNETLPYLTARQLGRDVPEQTPWLAYGIARGCLTELDGKPKTSGKTTWLARLTRAVLEGAPFLGWRTVRAPVVLMSEQGRTSLRATLGRAGLLERDDLYLVLWHDARAMDWPALVAAAVELCRDKGAELLIVDTLPQFARMAGDAENDAGAALRAMEPLQAAAAAGLAVLLSRHDRKSGGDVGDSARGSGAFTGSVDVVLALRRGGDGERPAIRHLHCLSRFDELPDELVIELAEDGYRAVGTAAAYAQLEAREKVMESLPATGGEGLTMAEIVTETETRRSTVQAVVMDLLAEGRVARTGTGKRADAYRYSVSAIEFPAPAETPAETEKLAAAPIYVERIGGGKESDPAPAETPAETGGDLAAIAEGIFGDLGATWQNGHAADIPLPPEPMPGLDDPSSEYAA